MTNLSSRKRAHIPCTPYKPRAQSILDAYERLGVTKDEVSKAPVISTVIKVLDGGVNKAIEFLRGSTETDARKFLDTYDSLPFSVRSLLPIEAFCLASGLTTKRVFELITGACFEQSANVAELISRSSRPKLVGVAVKQALKPKNFDERKLVLQHEGYAPIPKTQVINVGRDINTDNRIQSVSIGELSGVDAEMAKINNRFNERLIGSGATDEVEDEVESNEELQPPPEPSKVEVEEKWEW